MNDWDNLVSRILEAEAGGARVMIAIAGPPPASRIFLNDC